MIIFLIVGLIALIIGVLSIVSNRFDQYVHQLFPDSALDQKVFSERNRYIIRRYVSGFRGVVAGIICVAIYVESNDHLRNFVASFFNSIFGR
jgi:hypothetical protein